MKRHKRQNNKKQMIRTLPILQRPKKETRMDQSCQPPYSKYTPPQHEPQQRATLLRALPEDHVLAYLKSNVVPDEAVNG